MNTASKAPSSRKEEEKTFSQKLGDLIRKYRTPIIAVFGGIVGIVVLIAVYTSVSATRDEASAVAMEKARASVASWRSEQDAAKKDELKKTLGADLDAIAAKWKKSFAAQEALFTKANIAVQDKDYEGAEKAFLDAAGRMPQSYLAPLALEAAAVAAEERGAADKAQEYYARIVKDYKDLTPNLAHAHFSLGRLAEGRKEYPAAVEQYEKLAASFADSDWTKLAKDRIIYLKAAGLAK